MKSAFVDRSEKGRLYTSRRILKTSREVIQNLLMFFYFLLMCYLKCFYYSLFNANFITFSTVKFASSFKMAETTLWEGA